MKPPEIVKVGCYDINVLLMEELESFAHGIYGHFSESELTIRINGSLSKLKMYNTLKHEFKHAAWYVGGLDEAEDEEIVIEVKNYLI